jgi:hypothetical protein
MVDAETTVVQLYCYAAVAVASFIFMVDSLNFFFCLTVFVRFCLPFYMIVIG